MATRAGTRAAGVTARPLDNGARPATWPTCIATAWTAAWLQARGRDFLGPRELRADDRWVMRLRWRDRRDELHEAIHRPTFVVELDVRKVAIELELTRQAKPRLQAVLEAHTRWIVDRRTSAVMWAGQDTVEMNRIVAAGEDLGLRTERGLLRVELVDTLKAYALDDAAQHAAIRLASRTSVVV